MVSVTDAVDSALAHAQRLGGADDTIVIVTDKAEASLRWAGNTMTTNGESVQRITTVVSIVRRGASAHVGTVTTTDINPAAVADVVRASQDAARSAPPADDAFALITDSGTPADWADAPATTGADVFGGIAGALRRGFDGPDKLYGFAHHIVDTIWLATSTGVRRRFTQPTGSVQINAKRGDASAWSGISTPWFDDVPVDSMLADLSTRLNWSAHTAELPAGRYETLLPPSAVADLMLSLSWEMAGRGAQEGRTAMSAPGGGTRVGEKLTDLGLTLSSDPTAPGLECEPFVVSAASSEMASVFDNGLDIGRVDWIRDGMIDTLAYPRAAAVEFGAAPAAGCSNLLMTGGDATLEEMIAATERGLLLTTLWYIREVDPTTALLTGLTRDGVYLIEDGTVSAAVNNFRFNESPLDLLRRTTQAGVSEITLPREWSDWATRTRMPPLRIPDFNMSSVSQAQ
ncbi:metallopeptidase TldD-related protein [Gordonia sp. (in: high G+C Gram-positive bacteria)]|jgi:predicted Zn-dependent protease|uniref:metallopeptidase TldD-related protein n=1 Tax=Gordonia sp. (in: high G+C Gram-positive bacteria) TaxID=84139 RepID=UPI001DA60711|nr:metallopeptidase TldD-related protein [Gordonia sp. (in: high G+C Gram-positive bacteria)]MCB1295043.1 TldD/PmbA family protein [Gordonia sp. (in: high G+C Gram-positive bacteria)]HMS77694.1 metallopeptidase TldD-related protein [Gordonia sp. (in: high G+C Gram-positive bacteria)]